MDNRKQVILSYENTFDIFACLQDIFHRVSFEPVSDEYGNKKDIRSTFSLQLTLDTSDPIDSNTYLTHQGYIHFGDRDTRIIQESEVDDNGDLYLVPYEEEYEHDYNPFTYERYFQFVYERIKMLCGVYGINHESYAFQKNTLTIHCKLNKKTKKGYQAFITDIIERKIKFTSGENDIQTKREILLRYIQEWSQRTKSNTLLLSSSNLYGVIGNDINGQPVKKSQELFNIISEKSVLFYYLFLHVIQGEIKILYGDDYFQIETLHDQFIWNENAGKIFYHYNTGEVFYDGQRIATLTGEQKTFFQILYQNKNRYVSISEIEQILNDRSVFNDYDDTNESIRKKKQRLGRVVNQYIQSDNKKSYMLVDK